MIAVVGATGVLGTQLIAALDREEHPLEELRLFASEKSLGKEVAAGGETLEVEATDFRGVKLAFIATPLAIAKPLIDEARKLGTKVIDFSGSFRADRAVPFMVPGLSPEPPADAPIIGIAGAAGMALSLSLAPLQKLAPIAWADVTGLYGAAYRGNPGVEGLEKQTAGLLSGRPPENDDPFPQTLAFNVLPHVGAFAKGHPQSSEELAAALDVARAVAKAPVVRMTALYVPVFHGLTLSISAQFEGPLEVEALKAALKAAPRLKLLDAPDEGIYPTARLTADDPSVHVGRVRIAGNHVWMVAATDGATLVADAGVQLGLERY